MPRWLGGKLEGDNRLIVCTICNHDKGGRTLQQWGNDLQRKKDPRASYVAILIKVLGLPSRRRAKSTDLAPASPATSPFPPS